jgi:uncharacterized protein
MTIFIDTSAILALFDRRDPNHLQAKQLWTELLNAQTPLLTTNYVVTETTALLQRRLGLQPTREFTNDIVPLIQLEWVQQRVHAIAIQTLFAINQRELSLVDCVSFVVMQQLKIATAFAFDAHFTRQGFACLT